MQHEELKATQTPAFPDIEKDIVKFASAHSWYKHLLIDSPTAFYLVPALGSQPDQSWIPVTDVDKLHWYFVRQLPELNDEQLRDVIAKHPVYLNCFIYRESTEKDDAQPFKPFHGFNIVHRQHPNLSDWIKTHYPELHASLAPRLEQHKYIELNDPDVSRLSTAEFERQSQDIRAQAHKIWLHLTETMGYDQTRLLKPYAQLLRPNGKNRNGADGTVQFVHSVV